MKKQPTKARRDVAETPEPGHLEDSLTSLVRTLSSFVKRNKIPILFVVALIVGFVVIRQVVRQLAETSKETLNERVYRLFQGPLLNSPDYRPPAEEVERLLADVKGTEVERYVLKTAGDFYLEQGESIQREIDRGSRTSADAADPPSDRIAERDALFDRAMRIATDGAARYGDDIDLQTWSAGVRDRIDGIKDTSWLPSGRTYAPKEPGAPKEPEGPEGGEATGEASEPEEGGAEGEAAVPAVPPSSSSSSAPAPTAAGPEAASEETPVSGSEPAAAESAESGGTGP